MNDLLHEHKALEDSYCLPDLQTITVHRIIDRHGLQGILKII